MRRLIAEYGVQLIQLIQHKDSIWSAAHTSAQIDLVGSSTNGCKGFGNLGGARLLSQDLNRL